MLELWIDLFVGAWFFAYILKTCAYLYLLHWAHSHLSFASVLQHIHQGLFWKSNRDHQRRNFGWPVEKTRSIKQMQVIHTQLVKLFISITIWRVLQAVCEWLMLFLTDIPWWRRAAVRPTLLIDLHNTYHMIRHWSIGKTRTHIQRFLIITSAIVIGVRPRKICHWRRSCPAAVQRDLPVCEGVSSWIVSSNVLEHFKAGVRLGNIYDASHFMTWDIHTYLQQAVLPAFFQP